MSLIPTSEQRLNLCIEHYEKGYAINANKKGNCRTIFYIYKYVQESKLSS